MFCKKCDTNERNQKLHLKFKRDICSECFLSLVGSFPNPYCEYCMGEGEFLGHSEDCNDDNCALAAGYEDCKGQMVECSCSILDNMFPEAISAQDTSGDNV